MVGSLKKGDDECEKLAWNFEIESRRGTGRPKLSWKRMIEKECEL